MRLSGEFHQMARRPEKGVAASARGLRGPNRGLAPLCEAPEGPSGNGACPLFLGLSVSHPPSPLRYRPGRFEFVSSRPVSFTPSLPPAVPAGPLRIRFVAPVSFTPSRY